MADPLDPTFTILYFAAASTYTDKTSELLPAPLPVDSLPAMLESRYPGIRAKVLQSCALTINLEYVDWQQDVDVDVDARSASDDPQSRHVEGGEKKMLIQIGDEVGIIPPVSSG
jgi:molybdopterin synthase sulfur carrier subunit